MTRIIAGRAGGRRITVPPTGTRPTSDRVREALFSLLEARGVIEDAVVLDLFAGSGALGIEALSRGALGATLVERDPRACAVIQLNLQAAAVTGGLVRKSSVLPFLRRPSDSVDLVFVDPPYADPVDDVLSSLPPWLSSSATVVVERESRSSSPGWPDGFDVEEPRVYGETALHVATTS